MTAEKSERVSRDWQEQWGDDMAMTFMVGSTNLIPYIAYDGLSYQLSDIDDPETGRTMSGEMRRGKIADKEKWKVKCRSNLTTAEMSIVISAISSQYVTVQYLSPKTNSVVSKTMYVGDRTAAHFIEKADGTTLWKDLSFSLIER